MRSAIALAGFAFVVGCGGTASDIGERPSGGPADGGSGGQAAAPVSGDGGAPTSALPCAMDATPVTLATATVLGSSLVLSAAGVFWTQGLPAPTGAFVPKIGGNVTTLATPGRVALVTATDAIVVTGAGNAADFGIVRVPLDGSAPTTLAANGSVITSVAADATYVYWGTNGEVGDCLADCQEPIGAIFRVPLAGGGAEAVLSGTDFSPDTIAIDDADVYWASQVASATPAVGTSIGKVAKTGGAATALVTTTAAFIGAFAMDADHLYWVQSDLQDASPTVIVTAPKSGAAPTTLATPKDHYAGPIALGTADLYWVDEDAARIAQVPKAGGNVASAVSFTLATGHVGALAADASGLYWTQGIACGPSCVGAVLHLAEPCEH